MKVKICGMKHPDNIKRLAALQPDMIGFIFYEKSPRFADRSVIRETVSKLEQPIKKVGVFVKAAVAEVVETCKALNLDFAQLHGGEDVEYCREVKENGIGVIKVFHVGEAFDLEEVRPFVLFADFFLFDTKTKKYGGSGKHFDWRVLQAYHFETPFLLSGGLGEKDLGSIRALNIPQLAGIDVNSQLEIEPGLKDIGKAHDLIKAVRE